MRMPRVLASRPRPTPGPCPFSRREPASAGQPVAGRQFGPPEEVEFALDQALRPVVFRIIRRPDFPAGDTHSGGPAPWAPVRPRWRRP